MSTETAQRRLLEAIAELQHTPNPDMGTSSDPLAAAVAGVQFAAQWTEETGQPGIGRIYSALGDLMAAVRTDLTKGAHRGD